MKFYDPAAYVGRWESGNDYNVLCGELPGKGTANTYPVNAFGFPIWPGFNNSHAAGRFQIQPKLWQFYAILLSIKDFSPKSQDAVFAACFSREGFNPWIPYDAKLAAAVAAVGGPSAFSLGATWLASH